MRQLFLADFTNSFLGTAEKQGDDDVVEVLPPKASRRRSQESMDHNVNGKIAFRPVNASSFVVPAARVVKVRSAELWVDAYAPQSRYLRTTFFFHLGEI